MNNNILRWEFWSAVVTIGLGFIFHFAFYWLHEWKPSAIIFAVNESVWEHCKIGFWPALFCLIVEYLFIKESSNNFWTAKALMLAIIPLTIIVLFFTYSGIIGHNILAVDISIFFIAVIFSQYVSYNILVKPQLPQYCNTISLFTVIALVILFSTLTFNPIHLPLFKDSRSGIYGIPPK